MKTKFGIIALFFIAFMACESEKVVKDTELPAKATEFIEAHFNTATIMQVIKDRDKLETSYDVVLNNQVQLSFDSKGECYEAEGTLTEKLPDSMIQPNVLEYVKNNYKEERILQWEKDDTDQEVKLSNGTELVFNLSGTFLRIDQ